MAIFPNEFSGCTAMYPLLGHRYGNDQKGTQVIYAWCRMRALFCIDHGRFRFSAQNSRDGQQYRPAFGGVLQTARIVAESELTADASKSFFTSTG